MQIAKPNDVITRMGSTSSMGNIGIAASSAMDGATPLVENILGTSLAATTRTDWFSYRPSVYANDSELILYLNQGFVSEAGVTVYLSDSTSPVLPDFSNATAVDAGYVDLDQETGTVTLQYLPYRGSNTVAVRYSAGFGDRDSSIPYWMKEAAITACIRVIHSQTMGHNKDDISGAAPELHRILYSQCIEHARPRGFGLVSSKTKVL